MTDLSVQFNSSITWALVIPSEIDFDTLTSITVGSEFAQYGIGAGVLLVSPTI